MKKAYTKSANKSTRQRESNIADEFNQQLELEGKTSDDLLIREEFKKLRGEYGMKKTMAEEAFDYDLEEIHR